MLRKLPKDDFLSFQDVVAMGFATESFESIVKRLEVYSVTSKDHCQLADDDVTPSQSLYLSSSSNRLVKDTSSTSGSVSVCAYCKKPGHRSSNCWVKYPKKAPKAKAHFSQLASDKKKQTETKQTGKFTYFRTPDGR